MTPAARRTLTLLSQDHQLVRGPSGWRVVTGTGFERVSDEAARELLASPWVIAHAPASIVLDITDAGRAALEETCADQTS